MSSTAARATVSMTLSLSMVDGSARAKLMMNEAKSIGGRGGPQGASRGPAVLLPSLMKVSHPPQQARPSTEYCSSGACITRYHDIVLIGRRSRL